jgi:hypothetical protein
MGAGKRNYTTAPGGHSDTKMIGPRRPNLKPQPTQAKNNATPAQPRQPTTQPPTTSPTTDRDAPLATATQVASIALRGVHYRYRHAKSGSPVRLADATGPA